MLGKIKCKYLSALYAIYRTFATHLRDCGDRLRLGVVIIDVVVVLLFVVGGGGGGGIIIVVV